MASENQAILSPCGDQIGLLSAVPELSVIFLESPNSIGTVNISPRDCIMARFPFGDNDSDCVEFETSSHLVSAQGKSPTTLIFSCVDLPVKIVMVCK